MDLSEFLLARIAEDEAAAREATPGPWLDWDSGIRTAEGDAAVAISSDGRPPMRDEDSAHVTRWDPARVLAESEAKRRIVETVTDEWWTSDGGMLRERILGLLAAPYADHPDFDPEWSVTATL